VFVDAGAGPRGTHGRDSGADRSRHSSSNYGNRVDAQGWGVKVTTTDYGDLKGGVSPDLWYTDAFNGTSSASPIVTGALAAVLGILKDFGRPPLTSNRARQLLRSTGSPQQDGPSGDVSQRIGTDQIYANWFLLHLARPDEFQQSSPPLRFQVASYPGFHALLS
jgi:hypothetical protein